MLDAIDQLLLDESPKAAAAIAVVDAPDLVPHAQEITDDVRVFCDDWRESRQVPRYLRVEHPNQLRGVDLAWARAPKSLAALDEIAASVQGAPEVTLLTGGRDKHLNRSMNEVLAKHFVGVSATLGKRKCRGLRAWGPNQLTTEWPKFRRRDEVGLILASHGATFAGNKIDAGTQLLLEKLDVTGNRVLDFGSGNGVIAAYLARLGHRVWARDVSWAAASATSETANANGLDIDVSWGDGLQGYPDFSFDAIVTNPPFHRGVAKDSTATLELFKEASRVLTPGGTLWCVFNSHLPWRKELSKRLGDTKVVAQNLRYTLTLTTKDPYA